MPISSHISSFQSLRAFANRINEYCPVQQFLSETNAHLENVSDAKSSILRSRYSLNTSYYAQCYKHGAEVQSQYSHVCCYCANYALHADIHT